MSKYSSIINLPHPEPKYHQRMTRYNRAAQFAPFAALTGYAEAINETGRIVDEKLELSEGEKEAINGRILLLKDKIKDNIVVTILYFVKDKTKNGGSYQTKTGVIKKIDDVYKTITLKDKSVILIDNIKSIEAELFNSYSL